MSLMQEVVKENLPIWDACAATPFVRELQAGTLPPERFKQYMIQDSIYLKHYARIYGKAIYHCETLRDIRLYYSMLGFITDTESAVRLCYLEEFGMTDDDIESIPPLPQTRHYIDFLEEVAQRGSLCEILMAVLPCMLSYSYIFTKIASEPAAVHARYRDFIEDYADERYSEDCNRWCDFADEKCRSLSEQEQKRLRCIFKRASGLELDFWRM